MESAGVPRVSVCVATRDRSARLARLVAALEQQTIGADAIELVLTDDGSVDDTPAVVERLRATSPVPITVLRDESSRGPAAGRNRAWRASRAPVVAFTDDDCVPTREWLEQGLAALQQGTVVVGRVERAPGQPDPPALFVRDLRVTRAEVRWYATANLFLRRADLEVLDGFDERYTSAACEDTDLGLRAEAMGLVPAFAVRALVHHDAVRATVLDKVRDQRRWADLALLMRDNSGRERNLLYKRWFWRKTHVDLLAAGAGLLLAMRSPRAMLLALPWLHGKLSDAGSDRSTLETVIALPGLFAIDTAEVVTVLRGSWRYRYLIV